MNTVTFADLLLTRLRSGDLDVYDGLPTATPAGNYAYVMPDGGFTQVHRYAAIPERGTWTAQIVCVGVDALGSRMVIDHVRDLAVGYRLDARSGTSPLFELSASRVSADGPENASDTRYNTTLTVRCYTARS